MIFYEKAGSSAYYNKNNRLLEVLHFEKCPILSHPLFLEVLWLLYLMLKRVFMPVLSL